MDGPEEEVASRSPGRSDRSRSAACRWLDSGGEQVAGREAAIGPPFFGDGEDLRRGGEMVEPIRGLNRLSEREVARQHDVFPLERKDEGALDGPRTYPGNGGELGHELVVREAAQDLQGQPAVGQPLR